MTRRLPSREERALWRAATRDVAPLAETVPAAPAIEAPRPMPRTARPRPAAPVPKRLPDLGQGAPPGLDRRSAERLRGGELHIEARLDLHGMTQAEAHRALDAFLARAQEAGRRCVLVITGKGGVERAGVLRAAVPRWLNEAPNRARLLAYAPAQPKHGGAGALYLLLRRRR